MCFWQSMFITMKYITVTAFKIANFDFIITVF
jgi:hypothetical protein